MKRFIALSLVLLVFSYQLIAQDTKYPKGIYMSFEELLKKDPSVQKKLEVKRRTTFDIKMVGGNDYKLISADDSIAKKVIRGQIWGYSNGDTLFINCVHYKVQPGYTNVISDGKFIIFKAGISQNSQMQKKQMQMATLFGGIGGGIAGAELAIMRFIYLVDKSTNQIQLATSSVVENLLKSDSDLLFNYQNESKKDEEDVILKYLKLINIK